MKRKLKSFMSCWSAQTGCLVAIALFTALLLVANIDWFRGTEEGGEYDDGRTEEDD